VRVKLVIASIILGLTATSAYAVNTKDYATICDSSRLKNSERKECREKFKAAKTDEERTALFKEFSDIMEGKRK
jgi:hypothetical protein